MFKLTIDPVVSARFPQYGCLVAYARNLDNKSNGGDEASLKLLRGVEAEIRRRFSSSPPSLDPHIAAWREAYRSFGAKPKRHLCSVEALISRVLESEGLPDISAVVNTYNSISLMHLIPLGGEDWDMLKSDNSLRISNGTEPFSTRRAGEDIVETPDAGEVIWADSEGVTCRRWNWRQCQRTAITKDTKSAYFVFDVLPPFDLINALVAAENLRQELLLFSPDLEFHLETIQTPQARISETDQNIRVFRG